MYIIYNIFNLYSINHYLYNIMNIIIELGYNVTIIIFTFELITCVEHIRNMMENILKT